MKWSHGCISIIIDLKLKFHFMILYWFYEETIFQCFHEVVSSDIFILLVQQESKDLSKTLHIA